MDWALYNELFDLVRDGRLSDALTRAEAGLIEAGPGRFEVLLGLRFTNHPGTMQASIDQFLATTCGGFRVKAVYVEMNGFTINWDEWYVSLFGYTSHSKDPWAKDWLAHWHEGWDPAVILTGMEFGQDAFQAHHRNEEWEDPAKERAA